MCSALRTLLQYHQSTQALRAQSFAHHSSTVADPNYLCAKKSLLTRLFTCPNRSPLDPSPTSSSSPSHPSPSSSSSSSSPNPSLPFHAHAGNAVRAAIRRSYYDHCPPPPPSIFHCPQRLFRFRLSPGHKRGLGGLVLKRGEDSLARRGREQQAEEEDEEDEPYPLHSNQPLCHLAPYLPTIILQLTHSGRCGEDDAAGEKSSITITTESPLYAHLLSLHSASLASATPHLPPLSLPSFSPPSLSPLLPLTPRIGDVHDEKDNDHIPLPPYLASAGAADAVQSLYEQGSSYVGHCDAWGQQGTGVMVYACGDRYEGGWRDGVYEGYGVMAYEGVGVYRGSWRGGLREGTGEWEGVEGERYEGEWRGGMREGQGREWMGERSVYSGGWVGNERSGSGVAWFDGLEYDGQWKGGVMHGQGRVRYSTGVEWEGRWVDGRPAEWQVSDKMGEGLKGERRHVRLTMGGGAGSAVELLQLLSQVVELQSQLQVKMSKVEALLVTPQFTAVDMHMPQTTTAAA